MKPPAPLKPLLDYCLCAFFPAAAAASEDVRERVTDRNTNFSVYKERKQEKKESSSL